MNYKNTGS